MTVETPLPNIPEWRPVEVHTSRPPATALADTPVGDAVAKLDGLALRAYEAAARHSTLITEAAMRQALDADIAAHGVALAAGEPDPGTPNVDKLKTDVEESYRNATGLAAATEIARAELGAQITGDAGEKWAADIEAQRTDALKVVRDALDALAAAGEALTDAMYQNDWREQVIAHERGEVGHRSSAVIAWPGNYATGMLRTLHFGNPRPTLQEAVDAMREHYDDPRSLTKPGPQRPA